MKKEYIHTGLSLIAIMLYITAICKYCTLINPLTWNMAGILVGVLSMLLPLASNTCGFLKMIDS